MTVANVRAQAELRHACERQLSAAEGAKAHSAVGDWRRRQRAREAPRLTDETHPRPHVRTDPDVIAYSIERRVRHCRFESNRCHSAVGDIACDGVPNEPDLHPQMVLVPRAGRCANTIHWCEHCPNAEDVADLADLGLTARRDLLTG